jgi:hypothetical protein
VAQKITVHLVDDMDGSEATQSVQFGLDGQTFEIDLNDSHADELRAAVDKFVSAGRRVGGRSSRQVAKTVKPSAKAATAKASNGSAVQSDGKTIRAWASANGVAVPARGRIPRTVVEQFEAANPH